MAKKKKTPNSYLVLIQALPLRPIRKESELDRAIAMIDSLLDRRAKLDAGERDYLDVLSDLVEAYEDKHYPMPEVESDAEALRLLIEAKELKQQELAEATGIANSTISAVLHGQRKLNRAHIETLARYFRVSPAIFLSARGLSESA
jgi:HTH-type transcriptional regulator/antitoxin HigA